MKVFISGSKKKIAIEGLIKERLDVLMEQNADILIGDCVGVDQCIQKYLSSQNYKNVTVYVSGRKTRNNIGGWNEKHIPTLSDSISGYFFRLAKDMEMAKEADCGLAVWDEESNGTFVNILCLLALNKKCEMYSLKKTIWLSVCSIEDIKPYVSAEDFLTGNLLFELYDSVSDAIKSGMDFSCIQRSILNVIDRHQRCCRDIMEAKSLEKGCF